MAIKSAKNKGHAGERQLAAWLNETFDLPEEAKRNLLQTREGGGDINVGNFIFEVKRVETLHLKKWWLQVTAAVRDMENAKLANDCVKVDGIVAFRQNNKEWEFLIGAEHIGVDFGFVRLSKTVFKHWFKQQLAKQNR